jgi:hypothetical protein
LLANTLIIVTSDNGGIPSDRAHGGADCRVKVLHLGRRHRVPLSRTGRRTRLGRKSNRTRYAIRC